MVSSHNWVFSSKNPDTLGSSASHGQCDIWKKFRVPCGRHNRFLGDFRVLEAPERSTKTCGCVDLPAKFFLLF